MDVLETLQKYRDSILKDELIALKEELETNNYDSDYKSRCYKIIEEIEGKKGNNIENPLEPEIVKRDEFSPFILSYSEINPYADNSSFVKEIKKEDFIMRELVGLRSLNDHHKAFKEYISEKEEIDENFIEEYFPLFTEWEINTMLTKKELSEPFLEKYFGAFDKEKIARYQKFSEGFFMKHFKQLDYNVVLLKGVNSWKDKDKRSKELDVFLRLKGIKI